MHTAADQWGTSGPLPGCKTQVHKLGAAAGEAEIQSSITWPDFHSQANLPQLQQCKVNKLLLISLSASPAQTLNEISFICWTAQSISK